MHRLSLLIAAAALALATFLFYRVQVLEDRLASKPKGPEEAATYVGAGQPEERVELAVFMGYLQRFHQKWWLAGRSGNTELARFYLHEMEEAMETIANGSVMDDGVDVSAQMRIYGMPGIDHLQMLLEKEGVSAMHAGASSLVSNCNACHVATGHPYIRIRMPATVEFPDQDFSPVTK